MIDIAKRKLRDARYYLAHREVIRNKQKEYYQEKTKDKIRKIVLNKKEYQQKYYAEHREHKLQYHKEYRELDGYKEDESKYNKEYYQKRKKLRIT